MAKKTKEDVMRDLYASQALQAEMIDKPVKVSNAGMRHSVRPRRVLSAPVIRSTAVKSNPVQPEDTALNVMPYKGEYRPDPSLPRWHELPQVETGARRAGNTALPVVDSDRDSATVRAFDLLRTRLRQTTQEHGWVNIAITAPTSGCGNTFTAVNLALSLSRISGSRTMLMDFNLRNPGIAKAFDITPQGSMHDFLAGHTPVGDHIVKVSDTLALGLNNASDLNASETLQAAETAHTMERTRAALQPELVIYDMPAMLTHDDVSAFLPQLDGVLLVSDGTQTMGHQLMECERMLDGQVPLLGVVLNRARTNSIPQYS
jgi:Mrp family chromosome partitioning ATPase